MASAMRWLRTTLLRKRRAKIGSGRFARPSYRREPRSAIRSLKHVGDVGTDLNSHGRSGLGSILTGYEASTAAFRLALALALARAASIVVAVRVVVGIVGYLDVIVRV
jgi:hypothetical protein